MLSMIEKTGQTETGVALYNTINGIGAAIAAPGKWFIVDKNGYCFGVAFLGVVGMVMAAVAITLGFS
jgi:hypothetical protein